MLLKYLLIFVKNQFATKNCCLTTFLNYFLNVVMLLFYCVLMCKMLQLYYVYMLNFFWQCCNLFV
jgi:hypothetical protein